MHCLCYSEAEADLPPLEEVLERQKHAVRNPLPVCRDCLKLDIKLPGGGTDFVKKRELARKKKAALKEKAVAAGGRKVIPSIDLLVCVN